MLPPHRSPRFALLVACLLSAALHALVLSATGSSAPPAASTILSPRVLSAELVRVHAPQAREADGAPERDAMAPPVSRAERSTAVFPPPFVAAPLRPPALVRLGPLTDAPPAAQARPAARASDTYYSARDLDRYPVLRAPIDLGGVDALGTPTSGRARLELHIDHQGVITRLETLEAEPGLAAEEARRAFAHARFAPAIKDGRAVRSRLVVEVTYGAEAPASAPVGTAEAAAGAAPSQ